MFPIQVFACDLLRLTCGTVDQGYDTPAQLHLIFKQIP